MKCSECVLYWTDEGEKYGRCHYEADSLYRTPWDKAPCEYEEEPEEEDEFDYC